MSKGPARTFDYDEARKLRAEGLTYAQIGAHFGVTGSAVYFAVKPEARARSIERKRQAQRSTCSECGKPCSWNSTQQERPRCHRCYALSQVTTVRADEWMWCHGCKAWKAPEAYYPGLRRKLGELAPHHGGQECRECSTARRRENRLRNREREQAYERARWLRKKAQAVA